MLKDHYSFSRVTTLVAHSFHDVKVVDLHIRDILPSDYI